MEYGTSEKQKDLRKFVCITNRHLTDDIVRQVSLVMSLGVRAVILREKDLTEDEYGILAKKLLTVSERYGTDLYLHTFVDTARALSVKKIHVPLFQLEKEPSLSGEFEKVGTSCHSIEDIDKAVSLGASYVTFSNVFETDCKKGLKGKGIEALKEACFHSTVPVYALGGMNFDNAPGAFDAGADAVCMMSGFMTLKRSCIDISE